MEYITVYCVCGIVGVLLTGVGWWMYSKGYVTKLENLYIRYKLLIETYGVWLEKNDPQLYQKAVAALDEVRSACSDGEISAKEVKLIYNRAKELYDLIIERKKRKA